ncbi:MEDS domain-containing protein [Mesobacillus subterraneus]|uniref:MEDS domain-containing protein n=1 Tax=Mesobacillus subterraneus TaxID=285983 RepID=UPI00203D5574|nr:MEDS domain-containing protein [Mesobacillus subterraneus]MCM3572393.1 MEDS domain-containing protein [Mesobacillus subterraneus]
MHLKEVNELAGLTKGHGLYFFENQELYVTRVVDFVISGLEHGEYSIIVENDRMRPLIIRKLVKSVDENSLEKVKFINNFDFYYAKGDFSVNSIPDFLPSLIDGYSEPDVVIRSWAHVEWRDEQEITRKLIVSEQESDTIVAEAKFLAVCAYDFERVSQELIDGLINCHDFIINGKE